MNPTSTARRPDGQDRGVRRDSGGGLWRSALGILGGRLAQPFFMLFLFFVSARLLTTAQFGVYVLLMGLLILFQSLASLGLGQVLVREIGQKPEEEGATIASVLLLSLPASLLSGALFFAFFHLLKGGGDLSGLSLLAVASLPFSVILQYAESVFVAHGAGGLLFRIGMIEQIVRLVLSLAALMSGFGLPGLIGVYAFGRLLAAVIATAIFFLKKMSPPLRLDRANLRFIRGRLASFMPMNFLANLYFRADVIMLAWLMTDEALGLYGCAMRIAGFSFIVPESAVMASFASFSRRWSEKDAAFDAKATSLMELLLGLGFLGAAGMAVFGGTLLTAFFGARYAASGPLLALLAFMLPAHGLNTQLGLLFQAAHREKTALALVAAATAIVFGSIALGVRAGGVTGAAVGTIVSIWLMALLHLRLARRSLFSLSTVSPVQRSLWIFAVSAAVFSYIWPADDLAFCLGAAGVALLPLATGGLIRALSPKRIREVFE